jgi:pyruvate formate lyase activating enzyme
MIASYFEKLSDQKVRCLLCPRYCELKNGDTGYCRVRKNVDGNLKAETYRMFTSVSFDPIEKKPLYHFYPGRTILSVGSVGCNMHCMWCQNFEISQTGIKESARLVSYSPEHLLELAGSDPQNIGIAFTYNEPTINFETVIGTAGLFKLNGYKNVLVTNGYVSAGPLAEYIKYINAFNVDVKAFDKHIHLKYTGAKLEPVLENLIAIKKSGRHLELTCLIVPGVNDDKNKFNEFLDWVCNNLGNNVPLHLSRYFPRYKFTSSATPEPVLEEFCETASAKIKYVYAGNMHSNYFENTLCPECQTVIIRRMGYNSQVLELAKEGKCCVCGTKIFVCS